MPCWDKYLSKATPKKIESDDRISNFLRISPEKPETLEYSDDWFDNWRKNREAIEEFDKFGVRGFSNYDFKDKDR